ncbi:GatB/YqeY domain-containing protein [Candidatus Dojkabacteria bacterium]|uniref:GatB/YqeY domain-containing protein n=1 Tax=Candidatus Dojkabacteria bacterium TaxID=2099670 RepID=A0A955I5Z9_9BACT|nr:GatB/YqeY domain-containing protein [Candidatus Dojkabacteria bacterium]
MSKTVDTLRQDLFRFKKEKNKDLSAIVEIVLSVIKNQEIAEGKDLTEDEAIGVLRSESKKMVEPIELFEKAGRKDLFDQATAQKAYIDGFLPTLMSPDEVHSVVEKVVQEMGELTIRDLGRVMGKAMQELKGKADGAVVKSEVEKILRGSGE